MEIKKKNTIIITMDTIRILLILIIFCSCNQTKKKNNSTDNNIVVPVAPMERIDNNDNLIKEIDSINRIKNYDRNSLLDTINLYDKRFVAEIELTDNTWYIISGRPCENCDASISLYLFPRNTQNITFTENSNTNSFNYPGQGFYYDVELLENELIYQINTFYGKCLDDFDEVIIWVQKHLNDDGNWKESVFMIQLFNDKVIYNDIETSQVLIGQINKFLINEDCFKIKGINQTIW